jgi:hypothetical protein
MNNYNDPDPSAHDVTNNEPTLPPQKQTKKKAKSIDTTTVPARIKTSHKAKITGNTTPLQPTTCTLIVTAVDISGIMCYVDTRKLVYKTEDILSGTMNPKVIGELNENGTGITLL